ncbi:MAG: hypothetical protein IIX94_01455, partial [Clostridia bacterium]|nr:hypothetical protein [Clostridia bacterium]
IQDGSRQTEQGKNYAPGTVKAINAALNQFVYFQQDTGISSFFARSVPVGDSVLSLVLRMVLFALIYIMTTIVCKKALPSRDEGLGRLHI